MLRSLVFLSNGVAILILEGNVQLNGNIVNCEFLQWEMIPCFDYLMQSGKSDP